MTTIKESAAALGETVNAVKDNAQKMRLSVSSLIDKANTNSIDALHSAASVIRAAGDESAEAIEDFAQGTSERLAATSAYIGHRDAPGVLRDLKVLVRRHPGTFLLLTASFAAVAGYALSSKACQVKD